EVEALAAGLMTEPVRVEVARSGQTVQRIEQSVELIEHTAKRARLAEILSGAAVERAIVFTRTKRGADRVARNLGTDGIAAAAIHGDKSQVARQKALAAFRSGVTRVLVASDIAARGIDVPGISHVVQFEMPDEPEAYVHRIGRTGRNGETGVAIALCSPEERDKLRAVEKLTRQRLAPGDDRAADKAPGSRSGRRRSARRKAPAVGQGSAKNGGAGTEAPARTRAAAAKDTTEKAAAAGQGGEAPVSLEAERTRRRRRRPRRRAA
ncbi:MAG: C-terminal helicase domain-containing protein, partial [Pseudomonadota bacterium]